MSIRRDQWLSDVLGRPAYAVPVDRGGDEPGFYYAKVPVADIARIQALTAQGFFVIDVNVTLALETGADEGRISRTAVEPARPEHYDALLEIAGSCFRYSRFHLDPAIPDELAHRVKREWLRSHVERTRGVELLAALDDGDPVGFLAVCERDGVRVIDLIGVATAAQGRGVGGALVAAFVSRHAGPARELLVGTQIANVPSLRLYAAHGFVVRASAYVLHKHLAGW